MNNSLIVSLCHKLSIIRDKIMWINQNTLHNKAIVGPVAKIFVI